MPKILQTLEIKGKLYVAPQNDHNFLIFIFLDRCINVCRFFTNVITMHDLIPLKTPSNMKCMLSCYDVSRKSIGYRAPDFATIRVDSTGEQFFFEATRDLRSTFSHCKFVRSCDSCTKVLSIRGLSQGILAASARSWTDAMP